MKSDISLVVGIFQGVEHMSVNGFLVEIACCNVEERDHGK
jgi:hypothetical protein